MTFKEIILEPVPILKSAEEFCLSFKPGCIPKMVKTKSASELLLIRTFSKIKHFGLYSLSSAFFFVVQKWVLGQSVQCGEQFSNI